MRQTIWRLLIVLSMLMLPQSATQAAQTAQIASYAMQVRLDPSTKTIQGTERITYRNPSSDSLSEIWLHLYLNAFRSLDTLWFRESGGQNRGYSPDPNQLGAIDLASLRLADGTDLLATAVLSETLLKVPLLQPLAPNAVLELDVTWTATLPRVFARTGFGGPANDFFMVGQWYPKMAVYHAGQWNTEPWHANAEFFHDIGSYDVSLDVPTNYIVGAVGESRGERAGAAGRKILDFHAEDVSDFAFAASPNFRTLSSQVGSTEVVVYYLADREDVGRAYLHTATDSLAYFSRWYGPYPYPRLAVIDVPDDAQGAGGMEYPMLITGGTLGLPTSFERLVTAHEVGHQWWPMQVLTNEAREPWLDEGLTEYSGSRYNAESGNEPQIGPWRIQAFATDLLQYAAAPATPATLPSWQYSDSSYGAVYFKMSMALWTLEHVVGTEKFRAAFQAYLTEYRFKHPTGADFRRVFEAELDTDLDWFWTFLDTDGLIDYAVENVTTTQVDTGYRSTVTLVRRGAVPAPVTLLSWFADGSTKREQWDGRTDQTTFTYTTAAPLITTLADPDRLLKAELDVINNGLSLAPEIAATTKTSSRFMFWVQTLLQTLGMFG